MAKSIIEVKCFFCLASFYRSFVKDFNTLAEPLTKIVKMLVGFKWGNEQEHGFNLLKEKLVLTPLISLPDFTKTFKIEFDASKIRIKAALIEKKTSHNLF
jgi:hypothetical protein